MTGAGGDHGHVTTLTLRTVARGHGSAGLDPATPRLQLEPVLDGVLLRHLLQRALPDDAPWPVDRDGGFGLVGVADVARPGLAARRLRQLAGARPRDVALSALDPGRLPLYVCPECADLGCGAVTIHVDHDAVPGHVVWREARVEDGYSDPAETTHLSGLGPCFFEADSYHRALLAPVAELEGLAARAVEAARRPRAPTRRYRRRRSP